MSWRFYHYALNMAINPLRRNGVSAYERIGEKEQLSLRWGNNKRTWINETSDNDWYSI